MTIKRRRGTITMAATTGSVIIGLGAPYARILRLEVKGDDADVNSATTFAITDAQGRLALTAVNLDAGSDDATALATSQLTPTNVANTVGLAYALVNDEAKSLGSEGAVQTDNKGGGPVIAASPVTVSTASGTSGDVFYVNLVVEV